MIPLYTRSVATYCRQHSLRTSSLLTAFAARNSSPIPLPSNVVKDLKGDIDTRYFHTANIVLRQEKQQQQKTGDVDDAPATIPHHKEDIQKMTSKAMINELRSYGINTEPLFEKYDLFDAVQKAREQQLLPMMNAMTAMKFELAHFHNVTNLDQYLERSE